MIPLSPDTVDLAHRLAAAQHRPVEEVVRIAIEEKAREKGIEPAPRRRDTSPDAVAERRARTDRFVAAVGATPVLDPRSPHAIADGLDASVSAGRNGRPALDGTADPNPSGLFCQ